MAANKSEIILAATDRTKAAFASASRSVEALSRDVSGFIGRFGGVAGVVGGAVAALSALENIKALKVLDQLDDLSEKTGISVEKLSELRFAGEATGTNFESLQSGIGRLSKQMAEAAGGNKEATATFKAMGVEVRNTDGSLRSSDQVLGDIADRFASYEDGAGKAALAQRVFGKSGAELIPLLNQGREGIGKLRTEAQALGAIYGGDLAKDAANFNDNIVKLRIASEAAAISVGGPFLKSLVSITNQMIEAKKQGGLLNAILVTIGGGVARTLGSDEIGQAQSRAKQATSEMQRIQNMMVGVELTLERDPGNEVAQKRLATYRTKIQELQKTASAASEELKALANAADPANDPQRRKEERGFTPAAAEPKKGAAPVVSGGDGGGGAKKAKDEQADAKRYLETLDKQLERTEQLSAVETALAEIRRINAAGGTVTEGLKQQILLKAADIDATKEQAENEKRLSEEREEAQKRLISLQDEGRRVFEDTRTPLEAYNAAIAKLKELHDAGAISADTYSRAVSKQGEALAESEKRAKGAGSDMDSFATRAAQSFQDTLGSGLADMMDGNFKNIGSNFKRMLNRMAADALAADISRMIFGGSAKGGQGGGLFGTLLSGVGSLLSNGAATSVANVMPGNSLDNLVNIKGGWGTMPSFAVGTDFVPEDMIAKIHKGERIVPAAENRATGGGGRGNVTVNPVFHLSSPATRETQSQIARRTGLEVERAMRRIG